MSGPRFIGISGLLCLVASCAAHNTPQTQLAPGKNGPKAYVYATYSGGLLNRQVDATFKVDQPAYAMVGHLGGDGRFEVLYPTDARESGRIPGGKYFRTRTFSAYYDAVPQLYSFAVTRYRSLSAQLDSYDGLGNGYIFVIASRSPLRFDRISDFGLWDDLEAESYTTTIDPRESIRHLAETIAGGREYTLKFAREMSSLAMNSSVDQMFDCAYFSGFGLSAFGGSWAFSSLGLNRLTRGYLSGCGNRYALYQPRQYGTYAFFPNPNLAPPSTPTASTHPPHSGRRIGNGPGIDPNRPTYNPPSGPTTTNSSSSLPDFAPRGRTRGFGTRATDLGGSAPPRNQPTYEPPRSIPGWAGASEPPHRYATPRESRVERATRTEQPREQPRAQPQREATHAQPARAQPAREAASPPAPRASSSERKPHQ